MQDCRKYVPEFVQKPERNRKADVRGLKSRSCTFDYHTKDEAGSEGVKAPHLKIIPDTG